MAQRANSNSFALLDDEEVDDVSSFLDRVAEKVRNSSPAAVDNQKQQASRHRQPSGSVKGERWRGRGDQGHDSGRFDNGHANRYEQNTRGYDGHQRTYREGNVDGSSDSYQRIYGGMHGSQRNYRGDFNYGADAVQNAGNHNGNGRGRGSGSGKNNASAYEVEAVDSQQNPIQDGTDGTGWEPVNESQGTGWEQVNESQGTGWEPVNESQGTGWEPVNESLGTGWEPVNESQGTGWEPVNEFQGTGWEPVNEIQGTGWEPINESQGKVHGSEGQSLKDDVKLFRNGNGRAGSDRLEYGGENSNSRGREGHSYGGHSRRNRMGELSNNPQTNEGIDGEKELAISGDNSGKTEWNSPLSTVVEKDAKPKHGKHKTEDYSESGREEEENNMTLEEYEKQLLEKRKALEVMKNSSERKVTVDKDFESMQLVDKKKGDSLFIKLNSEKDKLKKKDIHDKGDKVRKLVSINEFLKPADGETPMTHFGRGRGGRGRGLGERGGIRGSFPRQRGQGDATPALEDPGQFPILGGAVKD